MTTKEFLNDKVRQVYDDFIAANQWCSLNGTELSVNSYADITYQQKYIIKYFSAYFCEYYEMYYKFFTDFEGDHVNILSIGCGAGIDCYALNRVLIDKGVRVDINYIGLDCVDWSYRPAFDWAIFKKGCISSLGASDVQYVDLVVFPKSLTELSNEHRCDFANLLAKSNEQQNVYFINTYVTDYPAENTRVNGVKQFRTISTILQQNSLTPSTDPSRYYYKIRHDEWLGHSYDFFTIPDEVVPNVSRLKSQCTNNGSQSNCSSCSIDFYPILKANYLAFNMLKFERKV
ncbi:hypothetical protein VXI18_004099 [Vibrio parahaemolyticus]|nr:hypothetical protein [Vibrio parahaemolyticus]EME0895736.1 hypothetical protein [Vibrio parahaemolyticus]